MIGFKHFLVAVGILSIGGCRGSHVSDYGESTSGAQAWVAAEKAIGPAADTAAAIKAARSVSTVNLANAETVGYKRMICRVSSGHPQFAVDVSQGPLENTKRELDVAIVGNGFFRVKMPPDHADGFAFTRNGDFFVNDQGDLCLGAGEGPRLDPPINIPRIATTIMISSAGSVSVMVPGQVAMQQVGQINLYQFTDASQLNFLGGALYDQTDSAGQAIELKPQENSAGVLQQNFLEESNVDITRERMRIDFLDKWREAVLNP